MARKKSSRTQPNPDQFDLFAQNAGVKLVSLPDKPAPADYRQLTRKWLSAAIKQSGKSREQIAATLSGWTGVTVSKDSIDMWTKDSHPSDLPAHFVAPLTVILGANFLDWFAQQAGCRIAGTEQLAMAQIGQMIVIKRQADAQIQRTIQDLPLMKTGGTL